MDYPKVIKTHQPCSDCGSRDALTVYAENTYCFSCRKSRKLMENTEEVVSQPVRGFTSLPDRKLVLQTAKHYGVFIENGNYVFPYDNAQKVRSVTEKAFKTKGDFSKAGLFGQSKFSSGGRFVTICEGEFDAMAAFQMTGSKYPCVSIKTGVAGALKDCKQAYEWLDSFENIVICFDADKVGQEAAKQVAELFGAKAKIIKHLPEQKDAIYPWASLNKLTYGIRKGELVTLTAGSGLGKSQLLREIAYHVLKKTDAKIGLMFMEESATKTGRSMLSLHLNKPIHLPDVPVTQVEIKDAFDDVFGEGRFELWSHFGSSDIDNVVNRVRYIAKGLGCSYVFLDHISIIVSGGTEGDERKAIDAVMTKLRTLVEETGIALFVVSHLKRLTGDKGHEDGAEVSLSQLRGSGGIAQLSDMVLSLSRNGQAEDSVERNTTKIKVLKNRFSGDTGYACSLFYDKETGRMSEVEDKEDIL